MVNRATSRGLFKVSITDVLVHQLRPYVGGSALGEYRRARGAGRKFGAERARFSGGRHRDRFGRGRSRGRGKFRVSGKREGLSLKIRIGVRNPGIHENFGVTRIGKPGQSRSAPLEDKM